MDDIPTVKFAYVQWVGEEVKPMTKAKTSTHKGALENHFKVHSLQTQVDTHLTWLHTHLGRAFSLPAKLNTCLHVCISLLSCKMYYYRLTRGNDYTVFITSAMYYHITSHTHSPSMSLYMLLCLPKSTVVQSWIKS